jgi:hypothetical protein
MGDRFDVKYTLLPPDLQAHLWVLALDANTSRVNLAYSPGAFRTSLSYQYGGNLQATLGIRRYSLTLDVNPANGDTNLKLGMVYRGFDFGSTVDITKGTMGLELTYGRKLLPFPDELSSVFNAANSGLLSMGGSISAAPNDPLAWYRLHSNDIGAISKAVDVGRQIADQQKSRDRFGAGLRLNYTPQSGLTVYGGVAYYF